MADDKKSDGLLFFDLGKIALKIVIGLASFQLLAPLIWNYLSDLLHLRKLFSLNIFILIYFITPMVVVTVWWRNSKKKFLLLTDPPVTDNKPVDIKEKLSTSANRFVRLADFILYFLLVTNFFLLFFPVESCKLIYAIQAINFGALLLLVFYAHTIVQNNFHCFDDFSDELKSQKRRYTLFRFIFYVIFLLIVCMEFQYLRGRDYVKNDSKCICDMNSIKNSNELHNAFRLIDFKSSLSFPIKKLQDDSLRLHLLQKIHQVNNYKYDKDSVHASPFNSLVTKKPSLSINGTVYRPGKDSILGKSFYNFIIHLTELNNFIDSVNFELADPDADIILVDPPYVFDDLLQLNKIPSSALDTVSSFAMKARWFDATISIMKSLEVKVDRIARSLVAKVLSNLQMKGIFLFLTLFIFLMCLYVFLKINGEILAIISWDSANQKVNSSYSKLRPYAEANLVHNKSILEGVGIYMTVVIGLLLALLKPVNEDKINLDKPFQLLTVPGQIQSESHTTNDDHSIHIAIDSTRTYNYNFNISKSGEIEPTPPVELDSVTKRLIKDINDKVKKMNSSEQDLQIKQDIINKVRGTIVVPGSTAKSPKTKQGGKK